VTPQSESATSTAEQKRGGSQGQTAEGPARKGGRRRRSPYKTGGGRSHGETKAPDARQTADAVKGGESGQASGGAAGKAARDPAVHESAGKDRPVTAETLPVLPKPQSTARAETPASSAQPAEERGKAETSTRPQSSPGAESRPEPRGGSAPSPASASRDKPSSAPSTAEPSRSQGGASQAAPKAPAGDATESSGKALPPNVTPAGAAKGLYTLKPSQADGNGDGP
jgi:hypothetical protein